MLALLERPAPAYHDARSVQGLVMANGTTRWSRAPQEPGVRFRDYVANAQDGLMTGDFAAARDAAQRACSLRPESAPAHALLSKAFVGLCSWHQAVESIKAARRLAPLDINHKRRLADLLLALADLEGAAGLAEDIIAEAPQPLQRDALRLHDALTAVGRREEADQALTTFARRWGQTQYSRSDRPQLLLLAALPKSGSTSVAHALAETMSWPMTEFICRRSLDNFVFSDQILDEPSIIAARYNAVEHSHLQYNISVGSTLARYPWLKMVVHIRDPRDVMVSTLDTVRRLRSFAFIRHCPDWEDRPLERQLDWFIERYLPSVLHWIAGWLAWISQTPVILGGFWPAF
jgi:hypothetical protein